MTRFLVSSVVGSFLVGCVSGKTIGEGPPCPCAANSTCDPRTGVCVTGTAEAGDAGKGMPGMPNMPSTPGQPADDASMTQSPPCLAPRAPYVRRLTSWEYANTVADTLNVQLDSATLALLPPDNRANGFSNDSTAQLVSFDAGARYAQTADAIATALGQTPNWLAAFAMCNDATATCRDAIVRGLGLRLFRRPVTPDESASFAALFDAIVAMGIQTAADAASQVVRAMLQSPQFLYRIEGQTSVGGNAKARALDGYEVASRLSYLVRGSAPDPALLDAAAKGDLADPDKLRAQATRMLGQPRARENIQRYFREWFTLDDLDGFAPAVGYRLPPQAPSMKKETLDVVADQLWDAKKPLVSTMLTTRSTIVDPALAMFYGLGMPDSHGRLSLAGTPNRVGLLTHASVLTIAGGPLASMVQRGLFVFRNILCQEVGASPPGTTSVAFAPYQASQRQESEARLQHQECASCHGQFDSLGYAFEPFDSWGASTDTVRQDGFLTQTMGPPVPYANVLEYMDLLAQDPRVSACVTRKVAQFAWGRAMTDGDQCMLADIQARLNASQGRTFADLVAAVAADPNLGFTAVR